jgi:phosphoribulokinase
MSTGSRIDLSLDLYSILSLSERNFSLKLLTSEHNGHRSGELIIDGELSEHVVKKLELSIEQQTRVHCRIRDRSCNENRT